MILRALWTLRDTFGLALSRTRKGILIPCVKAPALRTLQAPEPQTGRDTVPQRLHPFLSSRVGITFSLFGAYIILPECKKKIHPFLGLGYSAPQVFVR